jgi:ATP-dependent DNA helicase RecQ
MTSPGIAAPTLATRAQLESAAARVVTALAGPDAVARPDQLQAAAAVAVEGRPALVVQATGWGKSAVYWIATAALREAGAGPTVVVSPLLALMRDQVAAAARAGIRAATVNSSNIDDWDAVLAALHDDTVDALLLSPERLANPSFAARWLPVLRERGGLVVIDEAHCLSDWGHDFRPDYRRVSANLVAGHDVPVLATTATANERVTADVAAQLGADTVVLRGSLTRDSLALCVVDGLTGPQRLAWIDTALRTLPGSGIVYALTVADAERIAGWLAHRGHDVAAYTGSTAPEDRVRIEDALRANTLKAVVATSALGMGYDKPDLAFCIHHGSPASPVDYYQQVGRAGRALDHAPAVLLPAENDERVWEYFATATVPDPDLAATTLAHLRRADGPMTVPALVNATGGRKGRVESLLRNLAVDGAVVREQSGWSATGADWSYDHERYGALVRARRAEADLMRTYAGACRSSCARRSTTPSSRGGRAGAAAPAPDPCPRACRPHPIRRRSTRSSAGCAAPTSASSRG